MGQGTTRCGSNPPPKRNFRPQIEGEAQVKPNLELIAHEVGELARMVSDKAAIANFVNKVHGTNYHGSDVEKILMGIKPTDSIPRNRAPNAVRQTLLMAEPIAWTAPISTRKGGTDPLLKALLTWGANNNGLPKMTPAMCAERLAA